jgi:hypothetical protein
VYVVIDQPADAADLESLTREIGGAMPGFLAAEYGRAVASALRAAHERGGLHGDVRPANLVISPLALKAGADGKAKRRPAPDAVVRLAELGLVPVGGPAGAGSAALNPYLPPERLDSGMPSARGDIYGLGATLYFLLTGRPPFAADDPELAAKIRGADPTPLASVRRDREGPNAVPEGLVALVTRMMDKNPERRPPTVYEAEAELIRFCRPGRVPPQPVAVPMAVPASAVGAGQLVAVAVAEPVAEAVPVAEAEVVAEAVAVEEEPAEAWGVGGGDFDMSHVDDEPSPRQRRKAAQAEEGNAKTWLLVILGGLLHISAITLRVLWLTGTFDSPKKETPTTHKSR